jgi:hypothetical protein
VGGNNVGLWFLFGLLDKILWTKDSRWRITFVLEKMSTVFLPDLRYLHHFLKQTSPPLIFFVCRVDIVFFIASNDP